MQHMKVVRLSALLTDLLYHQHLFLVLISFRGQVDRRASGRPEGWSEWKILMTSSATHDFPASSAVAQTTAPPRDSCYWWYLQTRPRKKSQESTPSSFHSNTYAYAVSSACMLPFIASQRGQGKGPLDVDDNTGRCFPFSAYHLRLQLPLLYISFPGLEDYHVIITATICTYGMTRWEQGGEARHIAIQSNLASPPFTHFCLYAYLQWAGTVRARYLKGFIGKKSFFENLIFSQFIQQHFAFYKARRGPGVA